MPNERQSFSASVTVQTMAAVIILLATILPRQTLSAEPRPIVAVFDIELQGVKLAPTAVDRMTNYLISLVAQAGFQVVPRDQLKKRLSEKKADSFKQCYSQSCQIDIGQELAAQKTLAAQVIRIGEDCKVSLTLFDLRKSASEAAGTASGACDETGIVGSVEMAVGALVGGNVIAKKEGEATSAGSVGKPVQFKGPELGAVPQNFQATKSVVMTDLDPDLLELYDKALESDKRGKENAPEAIDAWKKVAIYRKTKNPFVADSQKRVREWTAFEAQMVKFRQAHEGDKKKLGRLLNLKNMDLQERQKLFQNFVEQYTATFGMGELNEMLAAMDAESAKTIRIAIYTRDFYKALCEKGDTVACPEWNKIHAVELKKEDWRAKGYAVFEIKQPKFSEVSPCEFIKRWSDGQERNHFIWDKLWKEMILVKPLYVIDTYSVTCDGELIAIKRTEGNATTEASIAVNLGEIFDKFEGKLPTVRGKQCQRGPQIEVSSKESQVVQLHPWLVVEKDKAEFKFGGDSENEARAKADNYLMERLPPDICENLIKAKNEDNSFNFINFAVMERKKYFVEQGFKVKGSIDKVTKITKCDYTKGQDDEWICDPIFNVTCKFTLENGVDLKHCVDVP